MNLNLFLLIFSVLICVQHTRAKSVYTDSNNQDTLRDLVIKQLANLADESVKLGMRLIDDSSAHKSEDRGLKSFIFEMHRTPEENLHKIDWFFLLSIAMDFVSGRSTTNDTIAMGYIFYGLRDELNRIDARIIANEIHRKCDEFHEWLITEIDTNDSFLTMEELLQLEGFKEAILQFKEETDIPQRFRILDRMDRNFLFNSYTYVT